MLLILQWIQSNVFVLIRLLILPEVVSSAPKTLIKFILGLQAHSLSGEVSDYFTSSNIDIPSISAVSQRRDLLYPEILKSINRRFLSSIDNLSTLNGYYILAQDGSDINLPFWHDDTQISYGQDSIVCQYHR